MYLDWANLFFKLCKCDCTFAGHSGSLCDSLRYHNNRKFTTIDRDNDASSRRNCAALYGGGNWHGGCHNVLLTGKYFGRGETVALAKGVTWLCHKGHTYSFKRAEMKIFV